MRVSFAVLAVVAMGAPALADDTKSSVDWEGYYKGTLPCASCSGIDTWFRLNAAGKKTYYDMIETYQGAKGGTFRSSGLAKWQKDGATVKLVAKDEDRAVFVSEGYVELLGESLKPRDDKAYQLRKQDAFAGGGQQLLVDPQAVKKAAGKITFDGLINMEHRTEGGHKSLTARLVIDCKAKTYEMPQVAYFRDSFATGKLIHEEKHNINGPQPVAGRDDVVAQAAKAYCP